MTGASFLSSSSTAVITKTKRLMPDAPASLEGLSVLSLRHPDCHTGFQGELKNLFAGLLKSAELQVINPRPQGQTVHIRQCGLVHTLEIQARNPQACPSWSFAGVRKPTFFF